MELIRTLREKAQTKQVEDFNKMAEEFITLSDFDGDIYIAFHNAPLVLIDASWTTKEIIEELSKIRNNYVNAKIKKVC